ncbi:MAG TPA: Smr/MutS family protein, partial [Xenococcaceae cyanobacterium]
KTEKFYSEVSERAEFLQTREQQLKLSQEKAVEQAIAAAKAEIAQVIRRLQQGEPTAQQAQQATAELNNIAEKQLKAQQQAKKAKPSYKPQLGEKVRIPSLGQTGEVLSIDTAESQITVRFGLMKMNVSLADIESLDGQKVETKPKTTPAKKSASATTTQKPPVAVRTSRNTLDIRGSRVANAESDLENAIAKATESGILWIVHGKGTGRLRQGVHEFLQRHPQVAKYELAPQQEGGSGVTIVYLK